MIMNIKFGCQKLLIASAVTGLLFLGGCDRTRKPSMDAIGETQIGEEATVEKTTTAVENIDESRIESMKEVSEIQPDIHDYYGEYEIADVEYLFSASSHGAYIRNMEDEGDIEYFVPEKMEVEENSFVYECSALSKKLLVEKPTYKIDTEVDTEDLCYGFREDVYNELPEKIKNILHGSHAFVGVYSGDVEECRLLITEDAVYLDVELDSIVRFERG